MSDGEILWNDLACNTCHGGPEETNLLGPSLNGMYGTEQKMSDGSMVLADDDFLRESILVPTAKIADGYLPVMPTFKGQVSEEQIIQLISYIKTLK